MDIVRAFKSGGDDYVMKPFSITVLRERIKAVRRRQKGQIDEYRDQRYHFNFTAMQYYCDGDLVVLNPNEQKLLKHLITNNKQIVSREQLLEAVWPLDSFTNHWKQEFALFNAIGMTNRQLLHMLLYEGLYYFLIVSVISLIPGRALAQWVAFKAIPLQTSTLDSVSDIRLSTLIMLIVIAWIVVTVTLAVFRKIISESIVNRLNDIKE